MPRKKNLPPSPNTAATVRRSKRLEELTQEPKDSPTTGTPTTEQKTNKEKKTARTKSNSTAEKEKQQPQVEEGDESESSSDEESKTGRNEEESIETDDDSEKEWEEDNIASDNDLTKAVNKGQVRFAESYREVANRSKNKPVTEIQYQQRRLAIMVSIPEVDNNIDRLSHLVQEVNEMLKFARKNNTKFRLRPFDTDTIPKPSNKNLWRTRMIENDSSDFRKYCQGYYPFTPPRGGTYRLRINAVFDSKTSLPTLIENVTHDWGHQDGRSISDIKSQSIYDPVKIGYLMRATRYITHSYEMVDAMEWQAKQEGYKEVKFGISWGTIPSPVGGYDKETAVQAVIIETNKETQQKAVELLKQWYPLNPKKNQNHHILEISDSSLTKTTHQ